MPSPELLEEIADADQRLAHSAPGDIVSWAVERFGPSVALACSFEDLVLLDIVRHIAPRTDVVFLDTRGHFPETLQYVAKIEKEWDLDVVRTTPGPEAEGSPCGTENCCTLRKVEPLRRAMQGREAWLTSVKRVDSPSRATMPVVQWDDKFSLVKINPLATWTDDDVAYYITSHNLPEHPLWAQGYASIGCAAVTVRPLTPGDRRSGRWAGADKEECGLHEA